MLLFVRVLYILTTNPIGELAAELFYLRARDLRPAGLILLGFLLVEATELLFPALEARGWIRVEGAQAVVFYLNAVQALLLVALAFLAYLVIARYTHRGLDRRIRDSMATLAYVAGQRRRRAQRPAREEEAVVRDLQKRRRGYE